MTRRTRILAFGAIAAVLPAVAIGQNAPETDTRNCRTISDKAEQAECTERLLSHTWVTDTKVDKSDGSRTISIHIASMDRLPASRLHDGRATLTIRCARGASAAMLDWPAYIGKQSTEVRWRVDRGLVSTELWRVTQTTAWANDPDTFSKALLGATTLFADVQSYGIAGGSLTFDLTGMAEAVQDIQESCKW